MGRLDLCFLGGEEGSFPSLCDGHKMSFFAVEGTGGKPVERPVVPSIPACGPVHAAVAQEVT